MTPKPESRLRTRIATALRARGWLVIVQHGGMFSQVGVSDLLVCAKGRFCALEVKMPEGRPTIPQRLFLDDVLKGGGIAGVVRSPAEAIKLIEEGLAMAGEWDDLLDDTPATVTPQEAVAIEDAAKVAVAVAAPQEDTVGLHILGGRTTLPDEPTPLHIIPTPITQRGEAPEDVTLEQIAYDQRVLYDRQEELIVLLTQVVEYIAAGNRPITPPVEPPKPSRKRTVKLTGPAVAAEQTTFNDI